MSRRATPNESYALLPYHARGMRAPKTQQYCERVGVVCTLHQLRHAHATELVNDGMSLATIRKRLGHKNLQTTLRYAEQSDATADREIRAW